MIYTSTEHAAQVCPGAMFKYYLYLYIIEALNLLFNYILFMHFPLMDFYSHLGTLRHTGTWKVYSVRSFSIHSHTVLSTLHRLRILVLRNHHSIFNNSWPFIRAQRSDTLFAVDRWHVSDLEYIFALRCTS